jgi:hypothetical protein
MWQLKHFVISGIFASITFAVAFLLGSGVILATGIPATGGIVNIFVAVLIMMIGIKIVPKFGFATLTMAIMFAIAIPTVIGGSIGIYKVINGLLIGLTFDSVVYLGKRTNLSHIIGGALGSMVSIISLYYALVALGLPGVEKLSPLLKYLIPLQGFNGAMGSWVGILIFNKRLKKLTAVQRLMDSNV